MQINQLKITDTLEQLNGIYISKQKDIINIKRELYDLQDGICPLLNKKISFEKTVIDHKHRIKTQIPTLSNKFGFIRNFTEFRANAFEGKVWNFYKRLGLDKDIEFSDLLRNLANYHDNIFCQDPILHYTEVPKREKVKISEYNRVKKYYFDIYPRKKVIIKKPIYITEDWKELVKLVEEHIEKMRVYSEQLKAERLMKKNKKVEKNG